MSTRVIAIVGGAAVGKNKLQEHIVKTYGSNMMVSHTSRPMRKGEQDHYDYHFVDSDKFIDMLIHNEFIETRKYNVVDGSVWSYGLSKAEIKKDTTNIVIVDAEGCRELKNHCKCYDIDFVSIYVKCNIKKRIERYLNRDNMTEDNCYELCRRILDDRIKVEPYEAEAQYVLNNDNISELEYNIKKVGEIIGNM